jgi:hypothetical protein
MNKSRTRKIIKKNKLFKFIIMLVLISSLNPLNIGAAEISIPYELIEMIFSYLEPKDLSSSSQLNSSTYEIAHLINRKRLRNKIIRIEKLMDFDNFIPLVSPPDLAAISHIAVTQELWFEVMGNNPSKFKDFQYCPASYKALRGIPMCSDFPVETIQFRDDGLGNSDEEFLFRLNRLYESQGLSTRFRSATFREYNWADTEGGKTPKRSEDPEFWKFATYRAISDRDPSDLTKPSPSGLHQTHGVQAKKSNAFGFYRSGVWEWTKDKDNTVWTASDRGDEYGADDMADQPNNSFRFLLGGSWSQYIRYSNSGFTFADREGAANDYGAARLVKTNSTTQ